MPENVDAQSPKITPRKEVAAFIATPGIPEQVRTQLQQMSDRYDGKRLFNNFTMHLPHPNQDQPGMASYRSLYRKLGRWDTKFRDFMTEEEGHSELLLNQSPHEFYDAIDKLLRESNVDLDEIKRLQTNDTFDDFLKMHDMAAPTFIQLLKMGYNLHADLNR